MLRVKFIVSPSFYLNEGRTVNPAYWILRSYYKFRSKHYDKITWADAHFKCIEDADLIIKQIIDEKIDVLCLSIYIWNRVQYLYIAEKVKELNPKIVIIAGGPELDSHKNLKFWDQHPNLDYVVYGDGELAFKYILDHLAANEPLDNAVNMVTREKVYPFKVFDDPEYLQISPWLEMKEDVLRVVDEADGEQLLFNWEMSRGCPYECSFCDWTGGLHNKVKRRRCNWREEIDLFVELGVNVSIIDANWGIFKEDLEIHRYAVEKLGDKIETRSFSKLNKKTVYEMLDLQAKNKIGILNTAISIQDVNPLVLKNINRPDIPWAEHKKLIKDLSNKNSNVNINIELVLGLPGQTVNSFFETILELSEVNAKHLAPNNWIILTNSPAYKLEYQKKFDMKIEDWIWLFSEYKFSDVDSAKNSFYNNEGKTYIAKTVVGTYSCNFEDILTMHNFVNLYNVIKLKNEKIDVVKFFQNNKLKIIDISKNDADIMKKNNIFGMQTPIGFVSYNTRWNHTDIVKAFKYKKI